MGSVNEVERQDKALFEMGRMGLTAGSIEQSVAGLDGVVDCVGAYLVVHLPQPKAHLGHYKIFESASRCHGRPFGGSPTVIAAAELDGRSRHVVVAVASLF